MKLNSPLQACPPEIFECIIQRLELKDVGALRLVNREIAQKATQTTFKSRFVTKHVELTRDSLETFTQVTRGGSLGTLVQNLILVGVVVDPSQFESAIKTCLAQLASRSGEQHERTASELAAAKTSFTELEAFRKDQQEFIEDGKSVGLLEEAFRNLAASIENGSLSSLSLKVSVANMTTRTRNPPLGNVKWPLTWKTAADVFRTSMTALTQSGLSVRELDVFNSLQLCSLSSNNFTVVDAHQEGLEVTLGSLKSLSISLAQPMCGNETNLERREALAKPLGMSKLLRHTTQLEKLHVHWFNTPGPLVTPRPSENILPELAGVSQMRSLRVCVFRGLAVDEEPLLALLKRNPIREITLENMRMGNGSFSGVFDYCSSEEANMDYLRFHDLFERRLLLLLAAREAAYGSQTLERRGSEVRRTIRFRFSEGERVGSPAGLRRMQDRRREYGPP